MTQEYGVGAITIQPTLLIDGPPPTTIDDKQIQQELATLIASNKVPAPDADTIYALFFPQTTVVTYTRSQDVLKSCTDFLGYHLELPIDGGGKAAYVVVPRCPYLFGMSGVDVLTSMTARELVNTAADPFPVSTPAWSDVDDDDAIWSNTPLAGVASMCGWERQSYDRLVSNYMAVKGWSDASAKIDHDPCAPAASPYFAASPIWTESVTYTQPGFSARTTKGVHVPVGQTKTIEVVLWSDSAAGPWSVSAQDLDEVRTGTASLDLVWDRTSGKNGAKLHLTITALHPGKQGGGSEFVIWSQLGKVSRAIFGFVQN